MKTLLKLSIIILMSSCGAFNNIIDSIEHEHYVLWDECQAVKCDSITEEKFEYRYHCSHPFIGYMNYTEYKDESIHKVYYAGDTVRLTNRLKGKIKY